MRLVQYVNGDQIGVGVMRDDEIVYAGYPDMREFIEDVKASGLVARLIEKNKVQGLTVAPKA